MTDLLGDLRAMPPIYHPKSSVQFMQQVRQVANLVGKQAGPHSIGHGGSHFHHSLDCS